MITFGSLILSFFSSYLANQRGNSPETIASYSDCIRLLINYCCNHLSITVDKLALDMITDSLILDFLDYLEKERNNTPKTRNQRLAAIKTFFRFAARQEPTLSSVCERICNISAKKSEHKIIQPLENHEVKEILSQTDTTGLFDSLFILIINSLHDKFEGISGISAQLSADPFILFFDSRFDLANH